MAGRDNKDLVDEIGDFALFQAMVEIWGARRFLELVGLATFWRLTGVETVAQLRNRAEAQGLSKGVAYNAARDFEELRVFLEKKYGRPVSLPEALSDLKKSHTPQ